MKRQGLVSAILAGQLANLARAGLPLPGTSDAQRLMPLLPKPPTLVDARAPEVQREQRQIRDAVKTSARQKRKQRQAARRVESAAARIVGDAKRLTDEACGVLPGQLEAARAVDEAIYDAAHHGTGAYELSHDGSAITARRLDLALVDTAVRRAKNTRVVEAAPDLAAILKGKP